MKKITLFITAVLVTSLASAQWSRINSTTTETLNDVDFINANYGVIVGNRSTILLTNNGGISFSDINNGNISGDVYNVKVTGVDTIYVSTYDFASSFGNVYLTTNGGTTWSQIASDLTNHRTDLETPALSSNVFASSANLLLTNNYGSSWDTLLNNIAGTTSTDLLHFADNQTGHLSGNISGFIGYSAFFFRTDDAGRTWYPGDIYSFPNSNANTTMCFVNADTTYAFMNQYSGWMPSAINNMISMYNFSRSIPTPGDTVFTFDSQVINTSMPDYINDARFENSMNGIALGNAARIYRTTTGGSSWTTDYTDTCSTCSLFKMDFENGIGYVVGSNGTLVKYEVSTGINNLPANMSFDIYPNPGNGDFNIKLSNMKNASLSIFDGLGKVIHSEEIEKDTQVKLGDYPKGIYYIKVSTTQGQSTRKLVIE
jgi:photosystem II stability/assembly factor-like uncharacterized protein